MILGRLTGTSKLWDKNFVKQTKNKKFIAQEIRKGVQHSVRYFLTERFVKTYLKIIIMENYYYYYYYHLESYKLAHYYIKFGYNVIMIT